MQPDDVRRDGRFRYHSIIGHKILHTASGASAGLSARMIAIAGARTTPMRATRTSCHQHQRKLHAFLSRPSAEHYLASFD